MAAVLSNTRTKRTALLVAALIGSAFPVIGSTATHTEIVPAAIPTVVVRYQDLNLASDEGARGLYQRIIVAARLICGNPDNRDLPAMTNTRNCRRDAVTRAVQAVNNPRLAAVHAARGRQS
jgi:UrcA family protein